MRKFRRSICTFLSVVMLLTCSLLPSSAQSIGDSLLQPTPTDAPLYISTEACPDAYTDYVNQNVHRFLGSISAAELMPGDTLTVGTPFAFSNEGSDIYYFPILRGSEILYTFRVFPVGDGEYNGILGRSFVDELNELAATTSQNTPLRMVMDGETVAAYVGNSRSVIFEYPTGTFAEDDATLTTATATLTTAAQTVVNATEACAEVSCSYTVPDAETRGVISPPLIWSLDTTKEQQESRPWCDAYVAAAIIRCVTGNSNYPTAWNIAETIQGPGMVDEEASLPDSDVWEYANNFNIYPTYSTSITYNEMKNELDSVAPFVGSF